MQSSIRSGSEVLFPDYQPHPVNPDSKVTFLLDDDSQVEADKHSLGAASDVFKSMLLGGFRESTENVIKLQDVSKETLVLLLLHCNSYVNDTELSVGKPDVISVLELFIVSDKFLITNLNSKLIDYIKSNYFNSEHFVRLYKWCNERTDLMVNEIATLYEDACACLLVGTMKHKRRVEIFNSIIESGIWEKMKLCIATSFTQRMEQGDFE